MEGDLQVFVCICDPGLFLVAEVTGFECAVKATLAVAAVHWADVSHSATICFKKKQVIDQENAKAKINKINLYIMGIKINPRCRKSEHRKYSTLLGQAASVQREPELKPCFQLT